jgi:hypothetical protein
MVNRIQRLGLAAAALLAWAPRAPAQEVAAAPPARNWTLPLFTKEGYRQVTLRGDVVRPVSSDRIDATGMTVTVFSGDAAARVDSVLVSQEATFLLGEKVAQGEKAVRLVRDDVDVRGEGWKYYYIEKKVLIYHHTHVVFHAALPDILK